MDTLHPGHPAHRIPAVLSALLEWGDSYPPKRVRRHPGSRKDRITRACSATLNIADFDGTLFGGQGNGELGYRNHPFEVVPFAWNGTSGLSYGWAVLDEHQDTEAHPCVSYAPVDMGGACWLGDTTREALENMMVGGQRYWEQYGRDDPDMPSPMAEPEWASLCAAVGLAPQVTRQDIRAGGRGVRERRIAPRVRDGWRFEPSPDGTGVLALAEAFGEGPVVIDSRWYEDEHVAVAREHLAGGRPAAALLVLKATRAESSGWVPTVEAMEEVYVALGRPFMASRAAYWLEKHGKR